MSLPKSILKKKILLITLDSYYQNSLALDYIRLYALRDEYIKQRAEIKTLVFSIETNESVIIETILSKKPNIIGFSTYLWNIKRSLRIAHKLKRRLPEIKIILGGIEVSYNPHKTLENNPFIDTVIAGEGEIPFSLFLKKYLSGIPIGRGLAGIWHRYKGRVISGEYNQFVKCLNAIPSPFLSSDFNPSALTGDILYETYRGCVFKCSYCLYHRHAGKPRFFSINRIKKDLNVILKTPCGHIRIIDSTFNINKKRTKEILKVLSGTNKKISVEMSAEFFDKEMIDLCLQAGIRHIDIGLQSATGRVLKEINRSWHDKKTFRQNVTCLAKHPEITLNLELICGLPKETFQSFRASLDKAVDLKPDHLSVYKLQVLDGSNLRENADKYGIKFIPKPPYTVIETANMSKKDLDNLELLLFSNIVLYNTGICRLAFRIAVKRYKLKPSQIYELFIAYCFRKGLYSEKEMRMIANHYAVGNRFDRPLPRILSLDYLKSTCLGFFSSLAREYDNIPFRSIFDELVDYGYNLASLDKIEKEKKKNLQERLSDVKSPFLSRFSVLKTYSPDFFQTLQSYGIKMSETTPFGIVFFMHRKLGPTALALSEDLYQFLSLFDGKRSVEIIIDKMIRKSGLSPTLRENISIIQTIASLQSDFSSIGLLI